MTGPPRHRTRRPGHARLPFLPLRAWVLPGVALSLGLLLAGCGGGRGAGRSAPVISGKLAAKSQIPDPVARSCAECHQEAYEDWLHSQHARAHRLLDADADEAAFVPGQRTKHGSFMTDTKSTRGGYQISQTGPNAGTTYHRPEAVIGVEPLIQYLVPFPGGRLQVVDMAFDPAEGDWFNIYGEEDRQPYEWGFWKNRGMTWNVQCAFCHMTGLKKGYDPETDTYRTTWDAMGISCAQCHGPMRAHRKDPKAPLVEEEQFTLVQHMDNCASCHTRREDLTGDFRPGEAFFDHYRPTLPEQPGLYYADGQILEEDFEYGSFLMSRMHHRGIHCLDCHQAHTARNVFPARNNALCLSCHMAPGQREATLVDPLTHSHHQVGTEGDACIDCHMAETTYMARDPRRDHGFTIPDPQLTIELGIPNACSRCHADKSPEWAAGYAEEWYGDRMERRTRRRARAIARAWDADEGVVPELHDLLSDEEIPAWRSVLLSLLGTWANRPDVRVALERGLGDDSPLVRSAVVRSLGPMPGAYELIRPLRKDPSRLVRIDAGLSTLNPREREPANYQEIMHYLDNVCDQPAGALRRAQVAFSEGRFDDAERWARRVADWERSQGLGPLMLGRVLHAQGRLPEAESSLLKALQREPEFAEGHYTLALLYAEMGSPSRALASLKRAVKSEPAFGRAWYNLGLAHAQLEQLDDAAAALQRAGELMPDSPDAPYALATVYLRRGDARAARVAANTALERSPAYEPAARLLQSLE